MKVKVGELELLESQSIIGLPDSTIEIVLNGEGAETALTFIFRFSTDDENKEEKLNYNLIDQTTLEINMVNIKNSVGGGNTRIQKVGTFKGRELYYNIRVFSLQTSGNTVIINFYLGREVNNAQ